MNEGAAGDEGLWEVGWEGHLKAQRRRTAALPMSEKLQWLEDAQRLLSHLAAQRRVAGKNSLSPDEGRE
jgi:hypothetical protein